MLDTLYYGNSVQDWGISLLVIIGALLTNKLISMIIKKIIRKVTAKSRTRLDDILVTAFEKPVYMGIILFAIWISLDRLTLGDTFHKTLKNVYEVLITLNVTWFFARLFTGLLEENLGDKKNDGRKSPFNIDRKLLPVIKRGVLIFVWFIGGMIGLHNIGVTVTTLIGTLGIGGIAFALAAQDTIKNIFGGITIFTDKTFQIGDVISFDQMEGTVVDIGLRSTRLETYDKRIVIIPNYKLIDALITNISSEPARRIVMEIGLTYDTTPEKMQKAVKILRKIPHKVPDVEENGLNVAFANFADSSLVIRFVYFIRKGADIFGTRSTVNFEILRSFNEEGLNFAFPSRTLYIENHTETPEVKALINEQH
ncbi:Low conductance mechanosensitive channel YnaI [Tannerella forsythia]|nr:Low conductance mechanosensitive channel YnaI [Tannerella forsythia]